MRMIQLIILLIAISVSTLGYATSEPAVDESSSFLVISDIHLNSHTQHRMEFAPKEATIANDLDTATYSLLVDTIRANILSDKLAKPQFILLLGDLAGHGSSHEDVLHSEQIVFAKLKEAFPETPILYDFGNNDSLAGNYGAFRTESPVLNFSSPLSVIRSIWHSGQFLSIGNACKAHRRMYPCLIESKTSSGYYSAYLKSGLRLIALNSVMFSQKRHGYAYDATRKQLAWLDEQLVKTDASHETALLVMHIPPGRNIYKPYFWSDTAFWSSDSAEKFLSIIQTHHLSIAGILSAHTHKDEIKLVEFPGHIPLIGVYINAALSTSHGNAPSIRSYKLSQSSQDKRWELSDYQSYTFTREKDESILIHPLYEFKALYCSFAAKHMYECFHAVKIDRIERYLSAGNPNFQETIAVPDNIFITYSPASVNQGNFLM